jgi:hypothetical protein
MIFRDRLISRALNNSIMNRDVETDELLLNALNELTNHHYENCPQYRRFVDANGIQIHAPSIDQVPYIPARVFKSLRLSSINKDSEFTTLQSSGTTGSQSQIVLDGQSSSLQAKVLSRTITEATGCRRSPMLITDYGSIVRQQSARSAGVRGMMNLGRSHVFTINENDEFQKQDVEQFLLEFASKPFLIFGFTFMVWKHLYLPCRENGIDLSNGTLVHSGGWKQMENMAVDNNEFRNRLRSDLSLSKVFNFYGMVEQIGLIHIEQDGVPSGLRTPVIGDVVIRDPVTLKPLPENSVGLVQVLSSLPTSYPGHSVLTEDLGYISTHIVDGVKQRLLFIKGRIARAEVRGCSDVYVA